MIGFYITDAFGQNPRQEAPGPVSAHLKYYGAGIYLVKKKLPPVLKNIFENFFNIIKYSRFFISVLIKLRPVQGVNHYTNKEKCVLEKMVKKVIQRWLKKLFFIFILSKL